MHPQGAMEGIGYGLSPLEGVLSVVSNLLNADNYNGTYFEDGAFPPIIIQILGQVNQRDVDAYRQYLQSELMGNFHRPAIMAGGQEAKVLNLKDSTNRDMEFMEYMKFMARLLAAAYGLAGQDIGLTDDMNKAIAEVQQDLSSRKGYGSTLHLIKEVFNQEIIWKDFGYEDLEFDWVAEDMTDPKDQTDIYKAQLEAGIVTLNEARQKLGHQPYEAWADEPRVLTGEGYAPIIKAQDNGDQPIDETNTTDKKDGTPEKKDKEVGKERNYKDQGSMPDKSVDAPKTATRKSMLARFMQGLRKSANVFLDDKYADVSDAFRDIPAMFGELVNDDGVKRKVNKIFKDQDDIKLMKLGYKIKFYTYHYNEAVKGLFEFVTTNPHSFGGIILSEDERGVRYDVYVLRDKKDPLRILDIK